MRVFLSRRQRHTFLHILLVILSFALLGLLGSSLTHATPSPAAVQGDANGSIPANAPSGGDPAAVGSWGNVQSWPLVAVHAALMPNGKVLVWDAWEKPGTPSARLWDPTTGQFQAVPLSFSEAFCAGMAMLADGRQFANGGHDGQPNGIVKSAIFDATTKTWTRPPDMAYKRWYPTTLTLRDGRVLALGGSIVPGQIAEIPEVYDPSTNSWTQLNNAQLDVGEYPYSFTISGNRVLVVATAQLRTRILDMNTGQWTGDVWIPPALGTAAMYRPGKILAVAGQRPDGGGDPVQNTTAVFDLNQANPSWVTKSPMHVARFLHNLVLLPDGKVLATGGTNIVSLTAKPPNAVLPAELWDPDTETWTKMASMSDARMYHSFGLLLPDARVLVGGGGRSGESVDFTSAQIYSPPYLFKGARPTISGAPSGVLYGENMDVTSPDAADISSVSLVRLSSLTHTLNTDQRFIPLNFTRDGDTLHVSAPTSADWAPPGYYMLFILDSAGVPSVSKIVQLGTTLNPPPPTQTTTFNPVADAVVKSAAPTKNFGNKPTLASRATPIIRSYLRFDLQGLPGTIVSAKLRLHTKSASNVGYQVRKVKNKTWSEATITYSDAPKVSAAVTGSSGAFAAGAWTEVDVTSLVQGNGLLSLALTTTDSKALSLDSRETGANAPQLVVVTTP